MIASKLHYALICIRITFHIGITFQTATYAIFEINSTDICQRVSIWILFNKKAVRNMRTELQKRSRGISDVSLGRQQVWKPFKLVSMRAAWPISRLCARFPFRAYTLALTRAEAPTYFHLDKDKFVLDFIAKLSKIIRVNRLERRQTRRHILDEVTLGICIRGNASYNHFTENIFFLHQYIYSLLLTCMLQYKCLSPVWEIFNFSLRIIGFTFFLIISPIFAFIIANKFGAESFLFKLFAIC